MEEKKYSVLKIYASSTDKIGSKLIYDHLVGLAREIGLVGATVYRGVMGFGMSSKTISTSKFWELTEKLPIVIEIIDETMVLEEFYRHIEDELMKMKKGCLVTMEDVNVKMLKVGGSPKSMT